MKRSPHAIFEVIGHGKTGRFLARTAGCAVRKFARSNELTLRTNHVTGGWHDIRVRVAGVVSRKVRPMRIARAKALHRRKSLMLRWAELWVGTRGEGAEIVPGGSLGTA